ncbi:MAG: FeoA domain-containing protein [Tepidibacter sp.]|jgi:ferrous iron transport protein A|uniref:FeoA family protein n=1 Tax=Tepidibacter sp. TaxID=2529387 RepID=UPI0025FF0650|nr:FeoA domain-containing protein [Tepidibacter sp.]MCT4509373.1 FeoA domain-containing protein [Tepidibacter sp.]
MQTTLKDLDINKKCIVLNLLNQGISRRRMLDLGIIPGASIEVIRKSPLGEPKLYKIKGALIALRKEETVNILVKIIEK